MCIRDRANTIVLPAIQPIALLLKFSVKPAIIAKPKSARARIEIILAVGPVRIFISLSSPLIQGASAVAAIALEDRRRNAAIYIFFLFKKL